MKFDWHGMSVWAPSRVCIRVSSRVYVYDFQRRVTMARKKVELLLLVSSVSNAFRTKNNFFWYNKYVMITS